MKQHQVTEFIVVPPYEVHAKAVAARERFRAYLSDRFKGYFFEIAACAPVGDDQSYRVIPVLGFVGDEGQFLICEKPPRWLIFEIERACEAFDLSGKRMVA